MRARMPLSALGLGLAASLLVAAPAAAAPFISGDVTVNGTTWSVAGYESGSTPYFSNATRVDWFGAEETYDSGLRPVYIATGDSVDSSTFLQCAADGDRSTATDGTGDEILTCPLAPFESGNGTLTAVFEQRLFSDGATVRSRFIVTNASDATVVGAMVGITENYYQDDDVRVGASTTAGHPAADGTRPVNGDRLWITYDSADVNDYRTPVVLTAAGTADAAVQPMIGEAVGNPSGQQGTGNDIQTTVYPLPDLATGESIEIAQFTVWSFFSFDELQPNATETSTETPSERPVTEVLTSEGLTKTAFLEPAALFDPSTLAAVAAAWADRDRFDSLSVRDAAGIADPTRVLNWNPVEEELAATGSTDLAPIALLGALLILGGAATAATRRRTA